MELDEIRDIFFQECEEALLGVEAAFAACQAGSHDAETINTIFRAVHSIKGGAGAFGLDALQSFAHHYETTLDKVRSGALGLEPGLLTVLLAAFDKLSDHVNAARASAAAPADEAVLKQLAAACQGAPVAAAPAEEASPAPPAEMGDEFDDIFSLLEEEEPAPPAAETWRVDYRPGPEAWSHGAEPLLLLRELHRMGGRTVPLAPDAVPPLDALDPARPCCGWTLILPGTADEDEIRSVFDFLIEGCTVTIARAADPLPEPAEAAAAPLPAPEPEPEPVAPAPSPIEPTPPVAALRPTAPAGEAPAPREAASQTIRVDLDKLDRLVNLVGELVITQAMLAQRLSVHGLANMAALTELDHLTRELQDSAMSIRAQPVKTVFNRVPRIIRELEAETGKRVRLEVAGEMTEIDKTVVERIGEPLTHLIRNAVDHGLEAPAERERVGKPAEGVVRLSAEHRSGRIVISISDDGAGINREKVRAKAIERGIIAADAVLSHEEIDNLIFAPGFSTAETVSNISGRGVGMDVVRKNVQALGGRISIVSTPGKGSVFSLSLPLTLAVLDGMIVRVADETYIIPLAQVVESLRPTGTELTHLGDAPLLDVRGTYIPIQNVGAQLGVTGGQHDPRQAVLIVAECEAGRAVLMVDSIQDQRQVVVKSLEANYRAVPGLAGATILGDGRVALILDIDTLVARWRHEPRPALLDIAA